ncbi:two-partner secretion domain-containing protein [Leptothoe kymatousa]|uniref:Filamentous hemagglutinin N-terminal domain-containing protein n=1 Tax=Leptothoe kymatousa TAU-MAC 1615 TaxID=2364775 RepID=A0ABS5Y714_9CYAN|nr:filamentous hemagglutinin N-terminal domain-containing protein [Leptothoe kymatousa]MBT9313650.1 filamentous hemagglutinin N-terminal domain-containing protein [Leptothoe kymatousa TAU-MAC 1615]
MNDISHVPSRRRWKKCWGSSAVFLTTAVTNVFGHCLPSHAQVSIDGTTDTALGVNAAGNLLITEGTLRHSSNDGAVLFHSFEAFSPGTQNVYFNLRDSLNHSIDTRSVEIIVNRVTGTSNSFIDGRIGIFQDPGTPAPDVFLINPNGITFGENASIFLPGSFVASTADSLLFQDGFAFSATAPDRVPLLTMSAPIGLNFGATPNPIAHRGTIAVSGDHGTAALVGGAINLNGADIKAGGHNALGSVAQSGTVNLLPHGSGWSFDYSNIDTFNDISIDQGSEVSRASSAQLVGQNISVLGGSSLSIQDHTSGDRSLHIQATDALTVRGDSDNDIYLPSEIASLMVADEHVTGADIRIEAHTVLVQAEAEIYSQVELGEGVTGGDIVIDANTVLVNENGLISSDLIEGENVDGGNIIIHASNVLIQDKGAILSLIDFGQEIHGGDIFINANNISIQGMGDIAISSYMGDSNTIGNITLQGSSLNMGDFSDIYTDVWIGAATGGDINLQFDRAYISESAFISADNDSRNVDAGGNISLSATEEIIMDGLGEYFGANLSTFLEPSAAGNAGNITVDTERLVIRGGASISGIAFERGNSGDITLRATNEIIIEGELNPINPWASGVATFTSSAGIRTFIDPAYETTASSFTQQNIDGIENIAGDISIETASLHLINGGQIYSQTDDIGNTGNITIQAENIDIRGSSPLPTSLEERRYRPTHGSAIYTTVDFDAMGSAGDINIQSEQLQLRQGGQILANTLSHGNGGNIQLQVADEAIIDGSGVSSMNDFPTGITTSVERTGIGNGGNIGITTGHLSVLHGGQIMSSTNGIGSAGDITIDAVDINLSGAVVNDHSEPTVAKISTSVDSNGIGNGGNININADTVALQAGGQFNSQTAGQGNAGKINATVNTLQIQGRSADGSQIVSEISAQSIGEFDAGTINIYAQGALELRDGGQLTVNSGASGTAGNINLVADSLLMSNDAMITAQVAAGNRGNIDITTDRYIVLNNHSHITTNATDRATGGNIRIAAPILLGNGNSDITANAMRGNGGNINIATQGLLGLELRDYLTPKNDISASSEFGLNGAVNIRPLVLNPEAGLTALPTDLVDPSSQIVAGCMADTTAHFVATGRGGVPIGPDQSIAEDILLQAFELSPTHNNEESPMERSTMASPLAPIAPHPPVEATLWSRNRAGEVMLTAPINTTASTTACLGGGSE